MLTITSLRSRSNAVMSSTHTEAATPSTTIVLLMFRSNLTEATAGDNIYKDRISVQ